MSPDDDGSVEAERTIFVWFLKKLIYRNKKKMKGRTRKKITNHQWNFTTTIEQEKEE